MRNLAILLFIAVCSICISCNNESGGMTATAKKNLEVNDAITKAFYAGDFSKMGDYIAADAIDHSGENGDVKGLDSIVAQMKAYYEGMPDAKASMTRSLADDDYVFTWSTVSGTMGGKPVTMSSVDISKFKDGKAVEHWVFMDPKELMSMMQPMPPVDQMATDTLKK